MALRRVQALDAEAARGQRRNDLGGMVGAVGLHGDVDAGALRRHVEHGAVVIDVEDVAAGLGDGAGDLGEHAGAVADDHADGDDLLLAGELAHHDRGGKARIDVAAGQDQPDTAAAEACPVGKHGRQPGGAGAFGHGLLQHEIGGDRLLDLSLADQHHIVDMGTHGCEGEGADILDGDAFGQRLAADPGVLAPERRPHGGIDLGLHADDLAGRLQRLDRDGDARDQAAATDRHDDRFEVRTVFDDLQADGALAGDDMGIVVGMDEHRAGARDPLLDDGVAIGQRLALEHHLGAEGAGGGDLHEGGVRRHDDGGVDAEALGVPGDGLGMIAGRHGDDAARAFLRAERQHLDQRAALLERGGRLQVLVFDPDVGAGELRQARGGQEGRADDHAGHLIRSSADVGKRREGDGCGHEGCL